MTDQELKDFAASFGIGRKETDPMEKELWENLKKHGNVADDVDLDTGINIKHFFQSLFKRRLEFGGIKYDEMILGFGCRDRDVNIKFDIVLLNENSIALIVVENDIYSKSVKKLAEEHINKFREYFPKYKDYKAYLGIVGFFFSDDVLEKASSYGIGIVRLVGDSVEIEAKNLRVY